MAPGALIAAYQEAEDGSLRALLPLAGRSLLEYQARCVAATGAAPIVVLVDRIPAALDLAIGRLAGDGVHLTVVSDPEDAASRFEPGGHIILVGDGIAPTVEALQFLIDEEEPTVATVPDDPDHEEYERIDAASRWAGIAIVDPHILGSTIAMLGDWDLQSTLLRRSIQAGATLKPIADPLPKPLLVSSAGQLTDFERDLIRSSRGARTDAASRFVLPVAEDFLTETLLDTRVRPGWLLALALIATLAAAFAFTRGWAASAMILLLLAAPLDLVARRLALLRLSPLPAKMWIERLLWPAAGLSLLALGWWRWDSGDGWGAALAALLAAAFAQAARIEQGMLEVPGQKWLFSRRNAILAAIPFAIAGSWTTFILLLLAYAAGSFFFLQYVNHRVATD